MRYMSNPHFRVSVGSEVYRDRMVAGASVTLEENAYWTAQLTLNNLPDQYLTNVHNGDAVTIEVKDWGSSYTKIFGGSVLFCDFSNSIPRSLLVQCVGEGYALNMMNCAEEYGTQSRNSSVDTIQEVLTNATVGVIPKYVEKVFASSDDSGYSIDTTYVEDLAGTIPYLVSQYKPCDKFLGDLCDLITSLQAGSAGPHWIVDHDGNLRVKTIGNSQAGWHKYVGNSQADATLTEGVDFTDLDVQQLGKQANVIVYYGAWRRPSSGDAWTETDAHTFWTDASDPAVTLSTNEAEHIVGAKSLKILAGDPGTNATIYRSTGTIDLNAISIPSVFIPTVNFYAKRSDEEAAMGMFTVYLKSGASDYFLYDVSTAMPDADTWYNFKLPLGKYYDTLEAGDTKFHWTESAGADWTDISALYFIMGLPADQYAYLDGVHIGGVPIIRVAREKYPGAGGTLGSGTNPARTKVIVDNVGKDDSLVDGDDSGLMAQLAYSELLRLQKESASAKFSTGMVPYALPGQYVYFNGKDWRATKIVHTFGSAAKYATSWEATDDYTNSRVRPRYESQNKIWEAIRPEWQDRQASSMKAGDLDIRIARLTNTY